MVYALEEIFAALTLPARGYWQIKQIMCFQQAPLPFRMSQADKLLFDKLLAVKLLSADARAPVRSSDEAAGYDLFAAHETIVDARSHQLVRTDIALVVPPGTYGRVAPRSGLALKQGIHVMAGVIDRDYRGNVGVILYNHTDTDVAIAKHDRIAQLIVERIETPAVVLVDELPSTARAAGGFGSTG